MNYVKQFHIDGVATKQVACIELHGAPNAATEGYVGVLGIDMDSPLHEVYKCVAVNGAIYSWELLTSGMSMISSTITGDGAESAQFPYSKMLTPAMYVIKIGDLIFDRQGYIYQITALNSSYCEAKYCGTQIVAHCPSGVYCGSENPPSGVDVWVDPNGESRETEEWVFTMEDDTTITRKHLMVDEQMTVLRLKDSDGKWVEIPALVGEKGEKGADGVVTFENLTVEQKASLKGDKGDKGEKGDKGDKGDTGAQGIQGEKGEKGDRGIQGEKGDTGYTPVKGVDYFDGENGKDGKDGVSVSHSWNGTTLTITSSSGTSSADLKGNKGDTGDKGEKGDKGDKGDKGEKGADGTVTFADLTDEQKASLKGEDGVYVGSDTPPETANVWLDETGESSGTETWTFTLGDGTTVQKTVVVVG